MEISFSPDHVTLSFTMKVGEIEIPQKIEFYSDKIRFYFDPANPDQFLDVNFSQVQEQETEKPHLAPEFHHIETAHILATWGDAPAAHELGTWEPPHAHAWEAPVSFWGAIP